MKKFTVPCNFGGTKAPFDVYIGNPKPGNHPLQNQASWLSAERGGTIPQEVMESFSKLLDLSQKHKVSFPELCAHAMQAVNEDKQKAAAAPAPPAAPAPAEVAGPGPTPGFVPKEQRAHEMAPPEKIPLPPQTFAEGAVQDKERREKSQMSIGGGGGGGGGGAGSPQPVSTQTVQKPEENPEETPEESEEEKPA